MPAVDDALAALDALLAADPISQAWPPERVRAYRDFSRALMGWGPGQPLAATVGKGGLSYYKPVAAGQAFVLHFNAAPRGGDQTLAFADMRVASLRPFLDLPARLDALAAAGPPSLAIKRGNAWCGLHFALADASFIARLLAEHIVAYVA